MVDFVLEKRRSQLRLGTCKLHYLMSIEAGSVLSVGKNCLFSILREAQDLARSRASGLIMELLMAVDEAAQRGKTAIDVHRTDISTNSTVSWSGRATTF